MAESKVSARAKLRMRRVLALVENELTLGAAPWFTGAEPFAEKTFRKAMERFEETFARWRHLFRAAEDQRDAARTCVGVTTKLMRCLSRDFSS